ncbi:substrate-binding domain-containing protein [Nocardioides sp. URHA0032]|uniref:substrate-binding domain-containing protein n=1 Tax=Nocardioides sp. URHA0032 TaxID=1380388 RepID=UPI00048B4623|nr:substrate-binding domain-containing protein [Nocardioides sp. URHA0032]
MTVPAPGGGDGATVTVTRTTDLVNQTVVVSWAGFLPSSSDRLQNSGDSLDVNTENPVRVYECRGSDPASSSDCYGSPGFRGVDATDSNPAVPTVLPFTYPGQTDPYDATPDGPANWQDNVTAADGTGQVSIQLFTKRESAGLGCDVTAPCSIVVVPNYGRPQGATEDLMDAPWAWERRTVVPLTFLPVDDACPLTGASLRVEGSPVAARAMASWRAKTCTLASDKVLVDYTAIGEPQTRSDVASGTTDAGLVIDPLDADAADGRGVVYAPLSVTGMVVAFQIDDANGKPVTDMKLNPRLVAKLITGSYRSGGNPAVIDNPVNLFRDPEFKELNPGVAWPGGAPGNHPLILGDLSDTTLALTRWIEADKDAREFIAGKPDPWGMTVNANYRKVALPFASFPLLDPLMSETYAPIQELDTLSRQLSLAQFPGAIVTQEGGVNVVTKPPRQNPGRREVIGIIDAASAARFQLSTAALENADGRYVKPTDAAMLTAIKHGTVGADGVTRAVDPTDDTAGSYPLSLQISGAFSTRAPKDERQEMADLLAYVARAGQQPGEQVGMLPPGHAPLSQDLVAQVAEARKAVLAGWTDLGDDGGGDGSGDGGDSTDPPGAPPGGGGGAPPITAGPAPRSDEPTGSTTGPKTADGDLGPTMLTVGPQAAGGRMLTLPVLGLVALVALATGPLVLWLSRTGRGPQWLRR